ncbi:MAG: cupin domain-containing protein [Deltaproteobacteria bacterium]|nr:cupin domain-containing protein [Deltaproteobacteria bacterium]MBF0524045.1 cupin domain-containing protein [Deltaproteobacteria bacterium]
MRPRVKKQSIGEKIKRLRESKEIGLDVVANDTGYAVEYLRSIESNEIIPPVAVLLQVARSLQVDSGELLKEEEEAGKKRADAYEKRTDAYSYRTLTPEARNKHLKAFHITIEALSDHKGVGYQHDGEEFVYVLNGHVEIAVGENITRLAPHESLHFNSSIVHRLKNVGDVDAELLVILYTP